MHVYRTDKFEKTYHTSNGSDLWEWLNREAIVAIMETASYLRRPAIEPLSPLLAGAFGEALHSVKVRQMIGHMTRQVLEARGYHLDRANVRISRPGNVFHFGSAYSKSGHGTI
jgi:hypothetical protein